jgi:hypothetical protein
LSGDENITPIVAGSKPAAGQIRQVFDDIEEDHDLPCNLVVQYLRSESVLSVAEFGQHTSVVDHPVCYQLPNPETGTL